MLFTIQNAQSLLPAVLIQINQYSFIVTNKVNLLNLAGHEQMKKSSSVSVTLVYDQIVWSAIGLAAFTFPIVIHQLSFLKFDNKAKQNSPATKMLCCRLHGNHKQKLILTKERTDFTKDQIPCSLGKWPTFLLPTAAEVTITKGFGESIFFSMDSKNIG